MRQTFPELERQKILSVSQRDLWSDVGAEALAYLREKRHLSDDVIRQFKYGYCPPNSRHELAGKILMPLFNSEGELVVFTTRQPDAPKRFQHWHESFDKGSYVYGLDIAKEAIRKWDKAIAVEGQFDVGCLHSYGFNMTVGVLGTSLSIMHVAQLARFCSEIYLLFDGDDAGQKSVDRAMELHNQYCLDMYGIHFIPVPISGDPDDFVVENGQKALVELMKMQKEKILNAR